MKVEKVNLKQVATNDENPRSITDTKFAKLVNNVLSFPKMLELRPIVISDEMKALGGNMRLRALQHISKMKPAELEGLLATIPDYTKATDGEREAVMQHWQSWLKKPTAPVVYASTLTEQEQRRFIILDNVGFGDWDWDELANKWDGEELGDWGLDNWGAGDGWANGDMAGTGTGEGNAEGEESGDAGGGDKTKQGALVKRFVVPPFSVLDARQGYWQERKKMWRELIGDIGESRNDILLCSNELKYRDLYQKSQEHRKKLGISFSEYLDKYVTDEVKERELETVVGSGVSLFDPVLSEICCKWFTPKQGAKIFDCFAGDTQKGFVFGACGYEFIGIELRQEQVDVNNDVIKDRNLPIKYICDDGQNVAKYIEHDSQDMLFSCPPYYDLEVYSDMPNDASNQGTYEDFLLILRNAYKAAIGCLKQNRFAVIVVGDVRNKKTGFYYNFIDDVKRIFSENGMPLYNEMILVDMCATTALRASRYMDFRKVGKTHQNVLVFYKGDTKQIKSEFPPIELTDEEKNDIEANIAKFLIEEEKSSE